MGLRRFQTGHGSSDTIRQIRLRWIHRAAKAIFGLGLAHALALYRCHLPLPHLQALHACREALILSQW